MDLKQLVVLSAMVSIVGTVFAFGLRATSDDVLYLVRRPGLVVRSLLAMFVIVPLVAVALDRVFDLRPDVKIALLALAISPIPPLLPNKLAKAGGDASYGLGLMTTLAVLSIAIVPLATAVLAAVFGRTLAIAPGAVAAIVVKTALLPLGAGMLVRALLPRLAAAIAQPVAVGAKILLSVVGVALLAGAWRMLWALVGDGTLMAMTAMVASGILAGHLLAGDSRDRAIVLAIASATRHPGIALMVAAGMCPDEHVGGTVLLYIVVSAIACMPYIAWQRRQAAAGA
jgi:bile acid:Na+ symporter, BASS family